MDLDSIITNLEKTMILLANEIVEIEETIKDLDSILGTDIPLEMAIQICENINELIEKIKENENMIEQLYEIRCKFEIE